MRISINMQKKSHLLSFIIKVKHYFTHFKYFVAVFYLDRLHHRVALFPTTENSALDCSAIRLTRVNKTSYVIKVNLVIFKEMNNDYLVCIADLISFKCI